MDQHSLRQQLVAAVAAALEIRSEEIDPEASFDAMGFDSLGKVSLVPTLERLVGCSLDSEALFDYPNLAALGDYIESIQCVQKPA